VTASRLARVQDVDQGLLKVSTSQCTRYLLQESITAFPTPQILPGRSLTFRQVDAPLRLNFGPKERVLFTRIQYGEFSDFLRPMALPPWRKQGKGCSRHQVQPSLTRPHSFSSDDSGTSGVIVSLLYQAPTPKPYDSQWLILNLPLRRLQTTKKRFRCTTSVAMAA
jgi:hypothetical protein